MKITFVFMMAKYTREN